MLKISAKQVAAFARSTGQASGAATSDPAALTAPMSPPADEPIARCPQGRRYYPFSL